MKNIKLYLNKLIYFFSKAIYKLLQNNYIYKLFIVINNLLKLLEIIIDEISWDLSLLEDNYNKLKSQLKELGIIRNLFLIFLLILGILPVFIFIYILFYFIKYIIKYLFLIIDYCISDNNYYISDDYLVYLEFKSKVFFFFDWLPKIIVTIYKFLFKSKWTSYFLKLLINYLVNKKNEYMIRFLKRFDYFILIYLPKKFYDFKDKADSEYKIYIILSYYKIKKKLLITYPWYIKIFFFRLYRKIYKIYYINVYKKIFLLYLRYYLKNYYRYKILKLKWDKLYWKIYYFIRIRYIKIKFTLIWFFKLFIWTTAFTMTIEAFFVLNKSRLRAYSIYIFMHFYYSIAYIFISKFNNILINILKIDRFFYLILFYIKSWIFEKLNNIYNTRFYIMIGIMHHLFIWSYLIFLNTYFWIDFKQESYFLEFGDASQSWWNLQLYAIVIKFFTKAYVTIPGTFWHTLKWKKLIWVARYYYWYIGNFKIKSYDISYFIWHYWILRKPQDKKIPDVEPNILQYLRR